MLRSGRLLRSGVMLQTLSPQVLTMVFIIAIEVMIKTKTSMRFLERGRRDSAGMVNKLDRAKLKASVEVQKTPKHNPKPCIVKIQPLLILCKSKCAR